MVSPINPFRLAVTAVANAYKAKRAPEQQEDPGEGLFQVPTRPDTFGDTPVDPVVAMSDELDAAYGDVEDYTSLLDQQPATTSDADMQVYRLWRPGEVPVQNSGLALRSLVRPGLGRSMMGRMTQSRINDMVEDGTVERNDDGKGFFTDPLGSISQAATGALGAVVNALIPPAGAQPPSILAGGATLPQYNDRSSDFDRDAWGTTDIHDTNVPATHRSYNWPAVNKVENSENLANFLRAFGDKYIGDMMLPQQGTSKKKAVPAFRDPEDGFRYFGWWLGLKGGPNTIREIANAYYPYYDPEITQDDLLAQQTEDFSLTDL